MNKHVNSWMKMNKQKLNKMIELNNKLINDCLNSLLKEINIMLVKKSAKGK